MVLTGRGDMTDVFSRLANRLADSSGQQVLLGIGAVVFAVECVLLASLPPVGGFENSIVAAYPVEFWFSFAVSLTAALLVFVGATLSYSGNWRYAFLLLAANYGVFFFLPTFRGYALYDRGASDALAHLGIVKSILQTDTLPAVFYPAEHLLLSTLAMHGVTLPVARYLFQFGFTLVFIGAVGILVRDLVSDERGLPAGLAAATPLVFVDFQVRINPAVVAVLLFPLLLFLIERVRRTDSIRYRAAAVALALLVVFFHPVTTGLLGVLVASTLGVQRTYRRYRGASGSDPSTEVSLDTLRTRLAGILLVVGFAWYVSFGRTRAAVERLSTQGGERSTVVGNQAELALEAGLSPIQVLIRFVQKYGTPMLYLTVVGIFAVVVLNRLRRREADYTAVYVAVQAVIGVGIALVFLNVYLLEQDPVRVSRYAIAIAVVGVGVVLYRLASDPNDHSKALALLTVCIVIAAALGTFAGTTYWPNKHMTHAEYEGAEFTIEHHDAEHRVRTASLSIKTQWYVTGQRSREGEPPVFRPAFDGYGLPPKLGYGDHGRAGGAFEGGVYLVTHAYDLEFDEADYFTPEQRRALGVYEDEHVRRLDRDPTANKVYSNGGFSLWQVTTDSSQPDAK